MTTAVPYTAGIFQVTPGRPCNAVSRPQTPASRNSSSAADVFFTFSAWVGPIRMLALMASSYIVMIRSAISRSKPCCVK